jgi:RNA polymerase sigma-70 factor (ECF subfamily)
MGGVRLVSSLPADMAAHERSCIDAFQSEFDYLCRTLRRLGVRSDDLEDDAHEVFLVLNRRWGDYDPARPLRPYLFGIAFRVVSARRRRDRREAPGAADGVQASELRPDEALEAADARALVLHALERIPLARRAVLVMHDIDEIPMREVASALSLPLFTGYSRLRKARRELEAAVRALSKGGSEP